jgi:hypothetical protein
MLTVDALSVAGAMSSLKMTVMVCVSGTPVAPLAGTLPANVGGTVSMVYCSCLVASTLPWPSTEKKRSVVSAVMGMGLV